jgi:hypothetical protein
MFGQQPSKQIKAFGFQLKSGRVISNHDFMPKMGSMRVVAILCTLHLREGNPLNIPPFVQCGDQKAFIATRYSVLGLYPCLRGVYRIHRATRHCSRGRTRTGLAEVIVDIVLLGTRGILESVFFLG